MTRKLVRIAFVFGFTAGLIAAQTAVVAQVTPIARWNFDNGTPDDPFNGLNGTLHGNAMIVADADANRGMVLELDSMEMQLESSYVDINDPTGLLNFGATGPHEGSATVAAWVYSDDWQVHSPILNQGEWRNGIGLSVKADSPAANCTECSLWLGAEPFNDAMGMNISVPANEAHRSDLSVGQGAWHHVAATWDYDGTQTVISFYVDGQKSGFLEGGVMMGRVTPPIDNDDDGVGNSRIGIEWRDTNTANIRWGFGGRIDDLMVFDTALDATGISDAMNGNVGGAVPVNLDLKVDTTTGALTLSNPTANPITITSYRITSASGSLNPSGWDPVSTGPPIAGFPQGNGTGNGWEVAPNPNNSELVEWNLTGESTIAPGTMISLGNAFFDASPIVGDYNGNGAVDAADYAVWRDTSGQTVTAGTGADGDNNGVVNQNDYNLWRANFGDRAGVADLQVRYTLPDGTLRGATITYVPALAASAGLGAGAVPEPSAAGLVALAAVMVIALRRRV